MYLHCGKGWICGDLNRVPIFIFVVFEAFDVNVEQRYFVSGPHKVHGFLRTHSLFGESRQGWIF